MSYLFDPTSSQTDVEDSGPVGENDYGDNVGMDTDRLQNIECEPQLLYHYLKDLQ